MGDLQWHLAAIQTPDSSVGLGRVTVAVLDTGVAYRTWEEDGVDYAVPPSLQSVSFEDGVDLVDGDDLPLDEHQHGTHITSLIASDGDVMGVAPGVSIMPVRVLDENNQGTEYALIEGIRYAVTQRVDVINMSLAFPPGYVPSVGLRDALRLAHSSGVIMVAAAGNDGRNDLPSWPAASPDVISVGSWTDGSEHPTPALYSNLGVSLDLMAPGGDLSVDRNADGYPDGLVGETISLRDPSQTGAWMFAGTSQATALVSGAAARMLANNAYPHEVRAALLEGAEFWGEGSFMDGTGAGGLDITRSLDLVGTQWVNTPPRFGASLIAWPEVVSDPGGRTQIQARARVTVHQLDGTTASPYLEVFGTRWGPDGAEPWQCSVSVLSPTCDVVGEAIQVADADTDPHATWAFAVEAVVEREVEVPYRPTTILWGSDALEVVLDAIDASPTTRERLLAVRWSKQSHPELGELTDGVMVFNAGTGLASSPFGVVFTPGAVTLQDDGPEDLDLDGTGLASSPIGLFQVARLGIDGTGLATSPIGFSRLDLVAIDGTGLASSPIGFGALDLFTPQGSTPTYGLGMDGTVLVLEDASILGASAGSSGMATRALLSSGGYQSADGYEVASLLVGSGVASVGLTAEGDAVASGSEGVEIPR